MSDFWEENTISKPGFKKNCKFYLCLWGQVSAQNLFVQNNTRLVKWQFDIIISNAFFLTMENSTEYKIKQNQWFNTYIIWLNNRAVLKETISVTAGHLAHELSCHPNTFASLVIICLNPKFLFVDKCLDNIKSGGLSLDKLQRDFTILCIENIAWCKATETQRLLSYMVFYEDTIVTT